MLQVKALEAARNAYITNIKGDQDAAINELQTKQQTELEALTAKHADELADLRSGYEAAIKDADLLFKIPAQPSQAQLNNAMSKNANDFHSKPTARMPVPDAGAAHGREEGRDTSGAGSVMEQWQAPTAKHELNSFTAPMTALQKNALLEILRKLKTSEFSLFFREPVDPIEWKVPTYLEKVKTPMDLGTMDSKLRSRRYGTVQEFVDDFKLIVNNTASFNGQGHVVTHDAICLDAEFEELMETVREYGSDGADGMAKKRGAQREAEGGKATKVMKK